MMQTGWASFFMSVVESVVVREFDCIQVTNYEIFSDYKVFYYSKDSLF